MSITYYIDINLRMQQTCNVSYLCFLSHHKSFPRSNNSYGEPLPIPSQAEKELALGASPHSRSWPHYI